MAYSFCPYCGAIIQDPAWRFCPSCGGRLPKGAGQNKPAAPAAVRHRGIPALVQVAGLFLLLIVAAVMVQSLVLHMAAAPAAANAPHPENSTTAAPSITDSTATATIPPSMAPPIPVAGAPTPDSTRNVTPPVTSSRTMEAPFPVPVTTSFVVTVPATPPYPVNAPAMGSSAEVPIIDPSLLETRIHELVNQVRQQNGLPTLSMDTALASIARAHSRDMAANGYFAHVNLNGLDPTARGTTAGYTCRRDYDTYYTYGIAENLFATYRYNSILFVNGNAVSYDWNTEETVARMAVDGWMNSTGHRQNLLASGVEGEGIGVAIAADDTIYITEDFC